MFDSFYKQWSYDSVPDMTGKNVLVTGGSSGLGQHSSLAMSRKGATVYVVGRDESKTLAVIDAIKKETGSKTVHFLKADFMDLTSVTACADAFLALNIPLHLLLNNAGIMAPPFSLSKDGIESQFATNHFASFVLTMKLMPILIASQPSRIVNLSSVAHEMATSGLKLHELNDVPSYGPWYRYGETKLANILFTSHLDKLVKANGHSQLYVNCCHPGIVNTNLTHNSAFIPSFVTGFLGMLLTSVENGAKTQMYLSTDPEIEQKAISGKYYVPTAKMQTPNKYALDETVAQELWDWTSKIVHEKLGDAVKIYK